MKSSESNMSGWEKAPSCVKRIDWVLQVWNVWAVIRSVLDCRVDRSTSDHSDLCWCPHLMLDRGLFTSPVCFLSNYSKKKKKTAGWSLVKTHFLSARVASSLPVTSLLNFLVSPSWQASVAAYFHAHSLLVCSLSFFPFALFWSRCHREAACSQSQTLIFQSPARSHSPLPPSPLSHFKKLSSPLSHATCRDIPLVPLWNVSEKGTFWRLTAVQVFPAVCQGHAVLKC